MTMTMIDQTIPLWVRYRGGRVWHRVHEWRPIGTGFATLLTECGFSGEAVKSVKSSMYEHNACKRCMTAHIGGYGS